MTGRKPAVASASGSPQSIPLLATKLYIPRPRPGLVARPRLLAQLQAGVHGPLTVLAAPAGWGKTSLLGVWCAAAASGSDQEAGNSNSSLSVAWVSLDAGDNDPVRFWTYVLSALDSVCAGVSAEALAQLRSPQPPPIEMILTLFLNSVTAVETEVVLVLDDYHVISAEVVHTAVTFLLDHLPPRFHLVLATREDPPLPLARRRAQGAVTELRAADLRFTAKETAQFLTATLGVPLTSEVVDALEARSEGWIAGLQLAALSLQGRTSEQAEAFIAAFAGSNRYIVDYLVEEVLARQPPEVQTFLLRTAIVERFCAPLCERLLDGADSLGSGPAPNGLPLVLGENAAHTPIWEHHGAQALLERVERANLFLIPLDDDRRWYRYHHLFAEVLRSRLRQIDADLPAALLQRASVWCEEEGLLEEAVEYALAGADFEHAAALLQQYGSTLALRDGRIATALWWFERLPEAVATAQPVLKVQHASLLLYADQVAAAEAKLREAEAAVAPDMLAPTSEAAATMGYIAGVQANLALAIGDVDRTLVLSQRILNLMPASDMPWRIAAQVTSTLKYQVSGDVTRATERQMAAALETVRGASDLSVLAVSITANLGLLQLLQGRLREAHATFRGVPALVPSTHRFDDLPSSHYYHVGLGQVLLEWNDLRAAEQHLSRGAGEFGSQIVVPADVVTMGFLGLARVQQARGEYSAALTTLSTFAHVARSRGFVAELAERCAAARAQVQLAMGNLAAAVQWAENSGLAVDDAVGLRFRREPAYLALARVRIAQGRSDLRGPYLDDALRLLERLLADAEAKGRGHSVLEILVLRTLALQAHRDTRAALGTLARALTLAEPEGYVRLFADEGTPMAALLTNLIEAVKQRRLVLPQTVLDYAQALVAVCRSQNGSARASAPRIAQLPEESDPRLPQAAVGVPPLLDPLTEREIEVLHLLAEGSSNVAIAARLVVTVGTVKKHVYNVCSKLGARNRTQAVARARALHLL